MCGIAGIVDLTGERSVEEARVRRMAQAIIHRGPDEEGFHFSAGFGLASRRLSIVGLADGQQPIYNENQSVVVVFNGELFDFRERRDELQGLGHTFKTHCDTEVVVHAWEEWGEKMFDRLRGQFAFCLVDFSKRTMILGRDRVGICPLHWAQVGDLLLFGSEPKAIVASGLLPVELDVRGLDNIMTFFGLPGRRTLFKGVSAVYPGTYLKFQWTGAGAEPIQTEHRYWNLDFPDHGDEWDHDDPTKMIEGFHEVFYRSVDLRLKADVPVVSYLSGGIDSTAVLTTASKVLGQPVPAFTIQIPHAGLDESDHARRTAQLLGSKFNSVLADSEHLSGAYPKLIQAADSPVIDTSCAALLLLSEEVHRQGYKVALTGEGSDESFGGYSWLKINRLMHALDVGGFKPSAPLKRAVYAIAGVKNSYASLRAQERHLGYRFGIMGLYHLYRSARDLYLNEDVKRELGDYLPVEEVDIPRDRIGHWHPINRSLYMDFRCHLPGLLLNHKGDRVAMANSVETRYPFLDEDVVAFTSKIHPRWKLRGAFRDKYLLREAMKEFLPRDVTHRPKGMFRAPFGRTFLKDSPAYVDQLLSRESLSATNTFDPEKVIDTRKSLADRRWMPARRLFAEMQMTAVVSTQLWHHHYRGGGLCELPAWCQDFPTAS